MRALTGVDTDRLPDEKRRGISLELGFAELSGSGISFIDVPGHRRLVHTMNRGRGRGRRGVARRGRRRRGDASDARAPAHLLAARRRASRRCADQGRPRRRRDPRARRRGRSRHARGPGARALGLRGDLGGDRARHRRARRGAPFGGGLGAAAARHRAAVAAGRSRVHHQGRRDGDHGHAHPRAHRRWTRGVRGGPQRGARHRVPDDRDSRWRSRHRQGPPAGSP